MRILAAALMTMATGSGAAAADRVATTAIMAGDFQQAEHALVAERRIFPARPELMLNLAAVYRQTGRDSEARSLYAAVLDREDVLMDLANQRTGSSHAIARRGMRSLSQVAIR